jgi:hypothetical protein
MFYFPDTHFFLHFKHPQDIPWTEVTNCDHINLIVGRTVQKELEKHKYEQRGRPQDRARSYAAKLAQIAIDEEPITLREKMPRVLLDFRATWPAGWVMPGELDPSWGDDMLVADVLAWQADNQAAQVAILTSDPGLIAKAKSFNIAVVVLAGHGWELPSEKTTSEKELEKLRRENADLKRIGPAITCSFFEDEAEIEQVALPFVCYPPLSSDHIYALLAEARTRHHRHSDFSVPQEPTPSPGFDLSRLAQPHEWRAPSQDEIDKYFERYEAWLNELAAFLRETPPKMNQRSVSIDLQLVLQNSGNEPAEGVQLTIETVGGFLLTYLGDNDDDDNKEDQKPPPKPNRFRTPPTPPRPTKVYKSSSRPATATSLSATSRQLEDYRRLMGHPGVASSLSEMDRLSNLVRGYDISAIDRITNSPYSTFEMARPFLDEHVIRPHIPTPKDSHAFYWCETPRRKAVDRWQLVCEEFRHRMDPKVFDLRITGEVEEIQSRNGTIRVRLYSRKLRQPFEKIFPIRLERNDADTFQMMKDLLP